MPSSLTDFMLLHVFTALLPPVDPEERDYYQVLGLHRRSKATAADIRKAYKVKSLELHPDKVAQRGGGRGNGDTDAEAEYQLVQEAYGVLNDAQKRKQYHSMGCSVARYRFVYDQNMVLAHPTAVYDNLSKASFMNKTRLILLASLICAVLLLQPILVAAKVNQNLKYDGILQNVSWTIILIPLWIVQGFMLIFWLFMLVVSSSSEDDETPKTRLLLLYTLLEHTSWLAGEILLALQWDNGLALQLLESRALGTPKIIGNNLWHLVSIPFYLGLFFRIMVGWTTTRLLAKEQDKMMTPERFEQVMVEETAQQQQQSENNPELQEDDPAIMEALAEKYTVVTVPEFSAAAVIAAAASSEGEELSEEEQEVLKVHMSPEFQAVQQVISSHYIQMFKTVILGFSFVALVACKLQGQLDSISWWVVFVPIWIYFGQALSGACWICCCTAPTQDMEVLLSQVGDAEALAQAMAENGDSKPAAAAAAEAAASSSDPAAASKMEEARQQTSIKVDFASAEGNIEEFNDEASPSCQEVPAASTPTTVDSTEEQDKKESAVEENDAENAHDSKPAAQQETEEAKEEEEDASGGAAAWNFEAPPISEEYMKQQARAQSSCCMALFGIMMVCLIVGKLEQDYPTIAEIQKSGSIIEYTGFNAFWILFPILLATCLLLCCCSCLIYGAGESSSLNDLVDRVRSDDEEEEEGGGETAASSASPAVMVIPMQQQQQPATEATKPEPVLISTSSTTTAAMDSSSSAASSPASSNNNKVVEEEVDMNDLD